MYILFPLCAFLILLRGFRLKGHPWRDSVLRAAVIWETFLAVITELLSLPHLLTRGWMAVSWLAFCAGGLWYCFSLASKRPVETSQVASSESQSLSRPEKALFAGTGLLLLAVGLLAVVAPPNTWDAMNYHLPRIIFWSLNHSVQFYPTPDYAQLVFGPGAEFTALHFYVLWGGDRLVNLVEFFSFLGVIVGASLLAEKLGSGRRGQILAAVVAATLPGALLEASGAMNTLVVTLWMVAAAYFTLNAHETSGLVNAVFAGLAVGLAILTKGSAYVFLPFVLLLCWWAGSSSSRIRMIRRIPALALLVLAINAGQFWRCYHLTGSPLGLPFPDGGPRLHWLNDKFTVASTAANLLRNVSLHLSTRSDALNARTEGAVRKAILLLGEQPEDPKTTWPGRPYQISRFAPLETIAGDPMHFALVVAAFLVLIFGLRDASNRKSMWFGLGVLVSFIFFCALLRWQEWEGRHHLPLFALSAGVVGVVFEKYLSPRWTNLIAAAVLVFGIPFALCNGMRAWVPWGQVVDIYHPRAELYFSDGGHRERFPDYDGIAREIRGSQCRSVVIHSYLPKPESQLTRDPASFYVYPMLALLKVDRGDIHVSYTGVANKTSFLSPSSSAPASCAVICLDCAGHSEVTAQYIARGGQEAIFGHSEVFSYFASPRPGIHSDADRGR